MKKQAADAIEFLDADHLAIHALFQAYRDLVAARAPALQRRALAEEICMELTIHARLEEELFYPAAREVLRSADLADETEDPHGLARDCIASILSMPPDHALYDAKVAVLAQYVEGHVRQEREQVFNRVMASGIDLHALGRTLAMRQEELRTVADALREHAIASAMA